MCQIENESRPLPIPEDSEELLLIAYMDNELPPQERLAFEKRLAEEPPLRQKLSEFEKTWNVLDFLETQGTDRKQVYSTLELIALQVEDDAKTLMIRQSKTRTIQSAVLGTVLLLLAVLGYQIVDHHYRINERQEIDDLLIIERLDQYYLLLDEKSSPEIEEIEFLRRLHESNILD